MSDEMYLAAVEYVKQGLALIPIHPRSKQPIPTGWQNGNGNIDTIKKCDIFKKYPDLNMGVNLAFSQICILDIDYKPAFIEFCQKYGLDELLTSSTRGIKSGKPDSGKLIFRKPRGFKGKYHKVNDFAGFKGCVVEFRCGAGRQDILPPSIHPSGTKYEWVGSEDFAEMPKSLIEFWENWSENQYTIDSLNAKRAPIRVLSHPSDLNDIRWFKKTLNLHEELIKYGAIPNGDRYVSPFSKTKTAGICILEDSEKWYSHNQSDPHADGHAHDAFDLWVYNHFKKTTGELSKSDWRSIYEHIYKMRYKAADYLKKNTDFELIAAIGV